MSAATRSGSPETSYEAAASVRDLRPRQEAVRHLLLMWGPMTDQDIVSRYDLQRRSYPLTYPEQSESGLRTRRSELVALGLAEFTGEFGQTSGGRRSRVWRAL